MRVKIFVLLTIFVLMICMNFTVLANEFYEPEVHDFDGETLTLLSWPYERDDEDFDLIDAEELFNTKLEFDNRDFVGYTGDITSEILAGDSPELIYLYDFHVANLVADGFLYPLEEVAEEYYESLPEEMEIYKDMTTYSGHTYGFHNPGLGYTNWMIAWNKDLFEELGLPSLYELMDNNEWTWDKMREIAKKATKDTDGDGENDIWGIGGALNRHLFSYSLAMTNNAKMTEYDDDGSVKFAFNDEAAVETLDYINELINEDEVFNDAWPGLDEYIEGNVAILIHRSWHISDMHQETDFDSGLVYFPKGPQGEELDYMYATDRQTVMAMPVDIENPKAVLDFYCTWQSPEGLYEERKEEAGLDQADAVSAEIMKEFPAKLVHVGPYTEFVKDITQAAVEEVLAGEKTPTVALDEITPEAQSALDEALE